MHRIPRSYLHIIDLLCLISPSISTLLCFAQGWTQTQAANPNTHTRTHTHTHTHTHAHAHAHTHTETDRQTDK